MAREPQWIDVGSSDELSKHELQRVNAKTTPVALSCKDGKFGAISHGCNHVGGPLGEGKLDGEYVVCP